MCSYMTVCGFTCSFSEAFNVVIDRMHTMIVLDTKNITFSNQLLKLSHNVSMQPRYIPDIERTVVTLWFYET